MASLAITLEEVYAAVGAEMGISRDSTVWDAVTAGDVSRVIRSGRRKFYNPVPTDGALAWKWSFMDQEHTALTTEPFSTGTVTGVDGAFTLSAGSWPAAAISENSFLIVDGIAYEVETRTSNTVLTITNTSVDVDAGTSFQLVQYRYALPSNFGGLNVPVTRVVGDGSRSVELEGLLEHDLRAFYANRYQSGIPTKHALVPKTDTETGIATWYIEFWPVPVAVYEFKVNYHVNPGDGLENDIDLAFADPVHSETLLEAILSAAEIFTHGSPGAHTARYQECLVASISRDKRNSGIRYLQNKRNSRRGYPIELVNAPLIYPESP